MPVTKTAKRALRSSKKKMRVNKIMTARLEIAMRIAKKSRKEKDIISAISLADKSLKKRIIHKNKAAHIKSTLSKMLPKKAAAAKSTPKKTKTAKN